VINDLLYKGLVLLGTFTVGHIIGYYRGKRFLRKHYLKKYKIDIEKCILISMPEWDNKEDEIWDK